MAYKKEKPNKRENMMHYALYLKYRATLNRKFSYQEYCKINPK